MEVGEVLFEEGMHHLVDERAAAGGEVHYHRAEPGRVVAERRVGPLAREASETLNMMFEEMHGEEKPTLTDPDNRTGGYVEKIDAIYENVGNGGVKIQMSVGAWTAVGTLITAFGLIAAALITALG